MTTDDRRRGRQLLARLLQQAPQRLRRYQVVGFLVGFLAGISLFLVPPLVTGPSGPEPGELVVLMDRDQSIGQQRKRLIEEWDRLHPDITVRIIELPGSATAAHSELVARAQAGGGGADVYSLDVTWVAEFAEAGWLRPLDRSTVDEAGYLQQPLTAGEYDGRLWALPFNTDAPLLFYRRDLVGDSPPATWAELIELTWRHWEAATAAEGSLQAGYAGQFADYEGFTVNVLEAMLAGEPEALSGNSWEFDPTTVASALTRLAAGFTPDGNGRRLILPDSLEHREDGTTAAFGAGQVLFMRNWPIAYRHLTAAPSGDRSRLSPEQVGVARLPSAVPGQPAPGVLGGQSLAVARGSDQPRAAQDLIEFLTGDRSQQRLFEGGFVPTRRVVYEDQELLAEHPYLALVREVVETAVPRPVDPRYELLSEAVRRVVRPYLRQVALQPHGGGSPPAAVPDHIAAQLAAELADARRGFRR
ncbi:MAG TPA: extracellular solute-binding protein [Natronosporangium sp.]|nr:extracellular solute-binding protein [Natronosporangium sp.]